MNQMIIDPMPKSMKRTVGIGNKMRRNAYNHTKVGKKYYLPIPWQSDTVRTGKHKEMKYAMLTCQGKNDYFGVFRTSHGLVICFNWFDLAIEYSKGATLT